MIFCGVTNWSRRPRPWILSLIWWCWLWILSRGDNPYLRSCAPKWSTCNPQARQDANFRHSAATWTAATRHRRWLRCSRCPSCGKAWRTCWTTERAVVVGGSVQFCFPLQRLSAIAQRFVGEACRWGTGPPTDHLEPSRHLKCQFLGPILFPTESLHVATSAFQPSRFEASVAGSSSLLCRYLDDFVGAQSYWFAWHSGIASTAGSSPELRAASSFDYSVAVVGFVTPPSGFRRSALGLTALTSSLSVVYRGSVLFGGCCRDRSPLRRRPSPTRSGFSSFWIGGFAAVGCHLWRARRRAPHPHWTIDTDRVNLAPIFQGNSFDWMPASDSASHHWHLRLLLANHGRAPLLPSRIQGAQIYLEIPSFCSFVSIG